MNQQFDFYNGGGLDFACLGPKLAGTGGGLKVMVQDGRLNVLQKGAPANSSTGLSKSPSAVCKPPAAQNLLNVTERSALQLTPQGLELIESASQA